MSEKTDVKKSIETVVEQILETEKKQEETVAAPVIEKSEAANGGATAAIEDPTAPKVEPVAAAPAEEVEKAKADDKDEDEKKKKAAKKDDKKDDKKPAFLKKSIEELAEVLDEEELELIKAWRDESTEEVAKSAEAEVAAPAETEEKSEGEDLQKSLAKAVEAALEPMKKSLEEKDSLIKSMNEKIEKMASQPAYDRRSISNLETIEKSTGGDAVETLSKSQIAEKMLGMQLAGKGVTSHHIAEFEATGNISDPATKALVFKELKLN